MLNESLVRELAAFHGEPFVTSFYLDVDGRRHPRPSDYQPHVDRLFRLARRRAAALDQVGAVEADLGRIGGWLAAGIERATTRGVALFSCQAQGYFRALNLPQAVHDQISLGPAPNVAQLSAMLQDSRPFLVVLADQRRARLFRFELGDLDEGAEVRDEPERQVDVSVELGSWEHHREEVARRHFRRVAEVASAELRRWPGARLILGGPTEDVSWLEGSFPADIAGRLAGRIRIDVTARPVEVAGAVVELVRDLEHRHEVEVVEELRQRAARGVGGVTGLPATLDVLGERRVGTLVISRGFEAWGARCPACGHLGVDTRQCPVCGTTADEVDDVVEVAVEEALAQHAVVEFCDQTELDRFGRIGAIERF